MLGNAKQMESRVLRARNGVIGEVKDFYYDDHHWHVRYLVVETGARLKKRKVLISHWDQDIEPAPASHAAPGSGATSAPESPPPLGKDTP